MTHKPSHHRRLGSKYIPPPRFSRTATEILGHPPYYLLAPTDHYQPQVMLPQVYSQLQTTQPVPTPFHPIKAAGGVSLRPSPLPEFVPQIHRAVPMGVAPTEWPSITPAGYVGHNLQYSGFFPTTDDGPLLPQPSDLLKPSPDQILHPAPRRPITLPGVKGPLLLHEPVGPVPHPPVSKTVRPPRKVHVNPSDYKINVEAIFREGSRFLPPATTTSGAPLPYTLISGGSPVLESRRHCGEALLNTLLELGAPKDPDLRTIVGRIKKRFSCFIDYDWLETILMPRSGRIPGMFFTTRGEDQYQKTVRSWVMTNTGITIYEKMKEALTDNSLCNDGRCSASYVWFVLLLREILVLYPYARELGALVRLGARELDPCDPSFRFFSLRKAVWELIYP